MTESKLYPPSSHLPITIQTRRSINSEFYYSSLLITPISDESKSKEVIPINEINLIQLINKILIVWYGSSGGSGCSINDLEVLSISSPFSTCSSPSVSSGTIKTKDNGARKIIIKIISSAAKSLITPLSLNPVSYEGQFYKIEIVKYSSTLIGLSGLNGEGRNGRDGFRGWLGGIRAA